MMKVLFKKEVSVMAEILDNSSTYIERKTYNIPEKTQILFEANM